MFYYNMSQIMEIWKVTKTKFQRVMKIKLDFTYL